MIKYNLKCSSKNCRHELPFDAWFKDSNAFEIQKNSGLLTCPYCGGIDVKKNLMSPSIQTKKSFKKNNIPFREFIIKNKNEEILGELFSYFILETVLVGKLMKINPFNQPAVEEVKIYTRTFLS